MNNSELNEYSNKARDSFESKLILFIYDYVAHGPCEYSLESFKRYKEGLGGYKVEDSCVKEYTTEYWNNPDEENHPGESSKSVREICKGIESIKKKIKEKRPDNAELNSHIDEICSKYISEFSSLFPEDEFKRLIVDKRKADEGCHYCGIKMSDVELMAQGKLLRKKKDRGWSYEIDRKDSNFEYTPENIVLCCYWCNNAKTDEFSESEFREIGLAISAIWKKRRKGFAGS